MELLNKGIKCIKGIGPKKAALLKEMGIETINDALWYFPRDYEELEPVRPICYIKNGGEVSLMVKFFGNARNVRVRKSLTITRWAARDDSGKVVCVWYNQPYRATLYKKDKTYFIHGKAESKYGEVQIHSPLVEEYCPDKHNKERIVPIYSVTEGITQKDMRNIMGQVISMLNNRNLDELPDEIVTRFGLVGKNYALSQIHFPQSRCALEQAKKRMIFDELFFLQLALNLIRGRYINNNTGIRFQWDKAKMKEFESKLPFPLTVAQQRVREEIFKDLRRGIPMNRMVHGDVGSGKTIVAAFAMYASYLSGYQGVVMVPTEVLAKQHAGLLSKLFKGTGAEIRCLVGSMDLKDKSIIKKGLENGSIDILVGTHTVIQEDVRFKRLGLVITDEQHRFGVRQRAALLEKGNVRPHMLVMSATPIPRTLALILYGDLDISIIDQMPPGRKVVKTYYVPPAMRERVYKFIRKQVGEGRQVYVVCPLIEGSEDTNIQSATDLFNTMRKGPLSGLKLGILHGRMKPIEKDKVMGDFCSGSIDVLISTTVIEVGVNVENASLMVIENAERFGLAQLHQLRGRVGRSSHQSYCILIADAKGKDVKTRMESLVKTSNGFEVSEKDLELRGPGDFLGIRQHGLPEFRIARLPRDLEILKLAQTAVGMIMDGSQGQTCNDTIWITAENFLRKINGVAMN